MLRLSLIITLLFASPVRAGFFDGNFLHEGCTSKNLLCAGYIAAISDVMDEHTVYGWSACVPNDVMLSQLGDIVTRWLDNNPQKRHLAANSLVAQALAEAFPC